MNWSDASIIARGEGGPGDIGMFLCLDEMCNFDISHVNDQRLQHKTVDTRNSFLPDLLFPVCLHPAGGAWVAAVWRAVQLVP